MEKDRIKVLTSLLKLDKPLDEISSLLVKFAWDSNDSVILEAKDIKTILRRYISGELDKRTVEAWANAIECRDDIVR